MHSHTAQITVGYVRDHHRHSLAVQRLEMAERGITRVYTDLALCIRQRRSGRGDVVAVRDCVVLADPRRARQPGGARRSMYEAADAIEAAGATLLELSTGRTSADPMMLRDAADRLSRTRYASRNIGRPPRVWTPEQMTIMRLHWHDMRHGTNTDAVEAIRADGVPVSVSQVSKALGPSGRARQRSTE